MAEDVERPHNELFELHFDNLPDPAYLWERRAEDFVLIAHNRAASELQYSHAQALLGRTAREIQTSEYSIDLDLARCLEHEEVVRRDVKLFFSTTGVLRPVRLTLIPVSANSVVVHSEDLEEREHARAKLDASERLYRTIVDNAHEGIWAIDVGGITLYANPRAADMLGYAPEDIQGRPVTDFLFEEDRAAATTLRARTNAGQRLNVDFRFRHRTGSTIWAAVAAAPVHDSDGSIVGGVVMISDVTARREAEQALRDSEHRLRVLLDSHPDSIMRVTRKGVYLDAHIMEQERHQVPFRVEDLIGKTPEDFFDDDFASWHAELRARALSTGTIQLWEYDRQVDGATSHYEARFVPAADDEVIVTVRNVTQRKRVENELSGLAAQLEALTEAAFDGVCISEDGRITEVSERFATILGYAPDELIGKPTSSLLEGPVLTSEVAHYLTRSGPYVTFGHRKDGTVLPVEVCAATVGDQPQRVYAIRDISTRSRLEQEIIDIGERERSRIGRDLHDGVGQILTGVSLAMGTLSHKIAELDPRLRKEVESITSTVQSAIGEVRDIARTLAPNIGGSGFRRALQRLADETNKFSSMTCRTEIDPSCEVVDETAATHLYRIAQEGLQNAVRHSQGRNILLRCARDERLLTLEIIDDGIGIRPEHERIDGTGLKNMRYRAHSLNGTLSVRRTGRDGTRLICRCYTRPAWFQAC